jgi:hypothetical protein
VWRGGERESSNLEKRELEQELTCVQDRRAVTLTNIALARSAFWAEGRGSLARSQGRQSQPQQTLSPESSAVFPGSAACTPVCHEWIDRS